MKRLVLFVLSFLFAVTASAEPWTKTIERVQPGIYSLYAQTDEQYQTKSDDVKGFCTAWMLDDKRGLLVTAGHCVDDANLHYTISKDSRDVKVIAHRKYAVGPGDIGLIQVKPIASDRALKLYTKTLHIGDEAGMLGYGFGYRQAQFGYVSLPKETDTQLAFFNLDTFPGDSGAPIVNRQGEVIAVECGMYSPDSNPAAHFAAAVTIAQLKDFLHVVAADAGY